MKTLVVDASIAVKWVVDEPGTERALALRHHTHLIAPELLSVECANILWKKVQRDELTAHEALLAARLLQGAEVELVGMRSLILDAARLAIELAHPAYDCVYLALASTRGCQFVTADTRLLQKLTQTRRAAIRQLAIPLA